MRWTAALAALVLCSTASAFLAPAGGWDRGRNHVRRIGSMEQRGPRERILGGQGRGGVQALSMSWLKKFEVLLGPFRRNRGENKAVEEEEGRGRGGGPEEVRGRGDGGGDGGEGKRARASAAGLSSGTGKGGMTAARSQSRKSKKGSGKVGEELGSVVRREVVVREGQQDEVNMPGSNFTSAVWTCDASNFVFLYDGDEQHLILDGEAIITPIDAATKRECGETVRVSAGQVVSTPAKTAIRWNIASRLTKRTSCREAFRMVANGWILRPPQYFSFSKKRFSMGKKKQASSSGSLVGGVKGAGAGEAQVKIGIGSLGDGISVEGGEEGVWEGVRPKRLCIDVGAEEDALAFYCDCLGMSRSSAKEGEGKRDLVVGYGGGERETMGLHLRVGGHREEVGGETGGVGGAVGGVGCVRIHAVVPDVNAVCTRIRALGLGSVSGDDAAASGTQFALVTDPWGNSLSLTLSGGSAVSRLRYAEFEVASREDALAFYMSKLGMKLQRTVNVRRWPMPDKRGDCLGYDDDWRQCCMMLTSKEESAGVGGGEVGSGGGKGVTLEMGCSSLEAVAAALDKCGATFERDGAGAGRVSIVDPDGLRLVFRQGI